MPYVKDRDIFGKKLIDFQNSQFRMADMKAEIMVERAFIDQCLGKAQFLDHSLTPVESSIAKLTASELEFRVADQCLQLHGGMGYAKEYHVERLFREVMIPRIAPVSREMILNFIGERVLGLPRSF